MTNNTTHREVAEGVSVPDLRSWDEFLDHLSDVVKDRVGFRPRGAYLARFLMRDDWTVRSLVEAEDYLRTWVRKQDHHADGPEFQDLGLKQYTVLLVFQALDVHGDADLSLLSEEAGVRVTSRRVEGSFDVAATSKQSAENTGTKVACAFLTRDVGLSAHRHVMCSARVV